jgi:hypothetical protein
MNYNNDNYNYNNNQSYDNINSEQVNKDILTKYGGISLTILIIISFIIFLILFYDSLCIEEKLNSLNS